MTATGRPVQELSDDELESQGTQAHETRNWVFLHGSAEQFANHTARMLALEQEYLRRHPKRTWQGSGGAATHPRCPIEQLGDPVRCLLAKVAKQPGGRMHKLELHHAAREYGLTREPSRRCTTRAISSWWPIDPTACSPKRVVSIWVSHHNRVLHDCPPLTAEQMLGYSRSA